MFDHWTQPLAQTGWTLLLALLGLLGIYALVRVGCRAYYKSRAEYEQEIKPKKTIKEED